MSTRYRDAAHARDNVLAIFRSQLGYLEGPDNSTKYGIWYPMNHQPWCNIVVSWVFNQAGLLGQPFTPKSAYVPGTIAAYRSWGQAHTSPEPGDVICLEENGRAGGHVGIVESVLSSSEVVYISGNTSDPRGTASRPAAASEQEGWGVFRRTHVIQPLDVFGRPDWAAAVATVIPAPAKPTPARAPASTATPTAPTTSRSASAMLITVQNEVLLWNFGNGPRSVTRLSNPNVVHDLEAAGLIWVKPTHPHHRGFVETVTAAARAV